MEVGGDHIICISDPYGIGIGIVGSKDRIEVIAVSRIAPGVPVGLGMDT